ncbi:MAG TPA: ATP-binding protein [Gemmataceae bacterium]|nr:ATP-binding protein [Gemmataceae bacterium]
MSDPRTGPPGVFSTPVLRRLLAIFPPAALLTGCVVLALYWQERAADHSLHEQAGTHLVDLHAAIIARELEAVESELLYLAGQSALRHYLAGVPAGRDELQGEYKLFCGRRAVYDQIRYLDADGRERVRVNFNDGRPAVVAEGELQPKADRYYFIEALRLQRGEVFVSPFDLNVEHGAIEQPLKPTLRFATPVFDGAGARRGVLVLNYLGAALLRKLAEVSGTFPGTALLLNREGHYLRGPTADDEWGFMLGHERTFAAQHPEAWSRVAAGEGGQFMAADGLFTYRVLLPRRAGGGPEGRDAGLVVVAHTPPAVLEGRSARLLRLLLLLYAAVLVVLLPLAWYLAYVGTLRQDHEQRLAESEARLRTLSAQLMTAQEEERRGISRDLHDELGQVVTSVTLDLQRAGQAADPARKDELIGRALHGAGCLLDRIHEISARVRPPMLDDLGLKDAVQSLLSDYERRSGVVTTVDLRFEHAAVPAAVSENVYRILQEALTNVSRHARAAEVRVGLHVTPDRVALTVRDAGVGFDPAECDGKRLGILGMRERAELLGGTFAVSAQPGRGTEVRVVIPLL